MERTDLLRLLGLAPARGRTTGTIVDAGVHDGLPREDLRIDGGPAPITATLVRPETAGPHPAILYCHAHGNDWDLGRRELLAGRPALPAGPYGPALAREGFAVLCLDMPGHGARKTEGSESALSRAALWRGGTLMGRMLEDLRRGLDVLGADPGVDAERIGALGLSMGATHAYWLAALDDRVAAVAHLCAFSDMAPLIGSGGHDLHGAYMTVPGLLGLGDMGDVAALVAPRPQLVAAGLRDPLTPPEALRPALARLEAAYGAAGAAERLEIVTDAHGGHAETPAMRQAVLRFLAAHLGDRRVG